MTAVDFRDHVFNAPAERRRLLIAVLERLMAKERSFRILDLGCGTGTQLLDIAAVFPHAQCIGVDISPGNIARARVLSSNSDYAARVSFHQEDYLSFVGDPFDVIIADSVLQNMPGLTTTLALKIGSDIRPAGFLIASLPYRSFYNRLLWTTRRLMRLLRGRGLERLAERAAQILHPSWPAELIRERLPYLYLLPERIDGECLRRAFHANGQLSVVEEYPVPHASPAQPKHRLVVFRKGLA